MMLALDASPELTSAPGDKTFRDKGRGCAALGVTLGLAGAADAAWCMLPESASWRLISDAAGRKALDPAPLWAEDATPGGRAWDADCCEKNRCVAIGGLAEGVDATTGSREAGREVLPI